MTKWVSAEARREYDRIYRKRHPEVVFASQKRYKSSEKGRRKDHDRRMRKLFGITAEDYDLMMVKQGNRCAICNKHQSEISIRFDVDHNHSTGKIRGLLCRQCNHAIGLLKESTDLCVKALHYLEKENG